MADLVRPPEQRIWRCAPPSIGYSMGVGGRAGKTPSSAVFDPATLNLSLWERGSFSASPWTSIASAGASNGRTMSEGTNPPSVGTTLNGYAPADFDGTNDKLTLNTIFLDSILGTSQQYWYATLIYADTVAADAGNINNPGIISDVGVNWGLTISSTGVDAFHYNGAPESTWIEVNVPCAAAGWHLVQVWHDGTQLNCSVDGAAGTPATVGWAWYDTYASGMMVVSGKNDYANNFFDGKIMEIMASTTDIGATSRANVRSYVNSRYGLSL